MASWVRAPIPEGRLDRINPGPAAAQAEDEIERTFGAKVSEWFQQNGRVIARVCVGACVLGAAIWVQRAYTPAMYQGGKTRRNRRKMASKTRRA